MRKRLFLPKEYATEDDVISYRNARNMQLK